MLASLAHNLRFVIRGLRRNAAFTVAVSLTLALAIGALSAVFSAVYAVLLRPLPYRDADRLLTLWVDLRVNGRAQPEWLSFPDFADWRDHARTLTGVAAYTGWGATVAGDGAVEPERFPGAAVSWNYFDLLGAAPLLGRTFRDVEDGPNADRVVIMSEGMWRRRFGADPTIVGKPLILNDEPWTVIGVMPASFRAPMIAAQIWRPLRQDRFSEPCGRGCVSLQAIARLKPGVTVATARTDLSSVLQDAGLSDPNVVAGSRAWPIPLRDHLIGEVRTPLLVLIGAVALVLVLACANLANLMLVRGMRRTGEIAVRLALGAERSRIRAELLMESVVLALLGGVGGLAVASSGIGILRAVMPPRVAAVTTIALDWRMVAFTALAAIATGLIFGAAPAWRLADLELASALRETFKGGSKRDVRFRNALVVVQFALALVLLNAAGLLTRSFLALSGMELGFDPERVVAVDLQLPRGRYASADDAQQFFDRLVERLNALPGVVSAAGTSVAPLSNGDINFGFQKEGEAPRRGSPSTLWTRRVTPGYLATMGMTLRGGRAISADDRAGAPHVAVINEAAARTYWPGESPLDKTILLEGPGETEPTRIVGVVTSVRHGGARQPVKPEVYVPAAQRPGRGFTVVVRGRGESASLTTSVRAAIREMEPTLPVPTPAPLAARVDESVALPRLFMGLLSAFGLAALALASVGIYGLVRYSVETRTREFGIRLAIGAEPSSILALVTREVMLLAALGVVAGVAGALAGAKALSSMLVGLTATNPWMLAATAVTLVVVGTAAMLVPARAAMRTDPSIALRQS
ncbi:MAG TPA: ABC transporter permease [Gemmatimonadaceae bacterium]|nr:ABC transporter permease [Gemmatimonadaceae bacterium]